MLYEELCNKYYNVKYYEDCIRIKLIVHQIINMI